MREEKNELRSYITLIILCLIVLMVQFMKRFIIMSFMTVTNSLTNKYDNISKKEMNNKEKKIKI